MSKFTKEELDDALNILNSVIGRCEKAQQKFQQGASQHTLLKNRIKALYISKSLILNEDIENKYTEVELSKALPPVCSVISKCEKAQKKFKKDSYNYKHYEKMIKAMEISKSLIEAELNKRDYA
ncbi:MAG: hypothetical protein GYA50_10765 [Eubacteriaceae bacterium]|nr:hypothetical protein [Eubacteriaceae bacterium]